MCGFSGLCLRGRWASAGAAPTNRWRSGGRRGPTSGRRRRGTHTPSRAPRAPLGGAHATALRERPLPGRPPYCGRADRRGECVESGARRPPRPAARAPSVFVCRPSPAAAQPPARCWAGPVMKPGSRGVRAYGHRPRVLYPVHPAAAAGRSAAGRALARRHGNHMGSLPTSRLRPVTGDIIRARSPLRELRKRDGKGEREDGRRRNRSRQGAWRAGRGLDARAGLR